jgi:hypothetical protein
MITAAVELTLNNYPIGRYIEAFKDKDGLLELRLVSDTKLEVLEKIELGDKLLVAIYGARKEVKE